MIRPMTGKESEKMKMHIRRILPAALALVLCGCGASGEESGNNCFYDSSAAGTEFDGMTADEVWQMYADDDFAYYFSGGGKLR